MNREKMIMTVRNKNTVVDWALAFGSITDIKKLFADGYCISTEALEIMLYRGFSKEEILSVISSALCYDDGYHLLTWLCGYLGQDEAEEFVLTHCSFSKSTLRNISVGKLEKYQKWNVLESLGKDDVLYKHHQYDKLSLSGLYKYKLYDLYFAQGDREINPKHDDVIDWLVKHKKWEILANNLNAADEKDTLKIIDILVQYEQFELILNSKYSEVLSSYPAGVEYLREKKIFVLIINKLTPADWDEWFAQNKCGARFHAVKHKMWDVLSQHKCHRTLLKHGKISCFFKSFF